MQPDAMDWKIIEILRNEHTSNNTLARMMDVSEGMIRNRIKRLKDAGILKIRAQINPEVLENQQLATVMVNIDKPAQLEEKAEEISALDNVLSVSIASGRYDLLVEVLCDSNQGLVRFLTKELSAIEGISGTETFLMLKSYNKFV